MTGGTVADVFEARDRGLAMSLCKIHRSYAWFKDLQD